MNERAAAVEAADRTCPCCGAAREADQRYCLECGLALPSVDGRLPGLRRRWLRWVGWYPGDWVWVSLLMLIVAAVGAASAIAVSERRETGGPTFDAAATVRVREPTTVRATTPTVDTSTLPTAPEPGKTGKSAQAKTKPRVKAAAQKNGRLVWPRNANGWTIVLVSYPKTNGRVSALRTATRAAKVGLHQVGVLDSSRYASLQPGYYVVFTGVYPGKSDADAAVGTVRQAGFGGAYSRQIAR
jgi:hypothetical protein